MSLALTVNVDRFVFRISSFQDWNNSSGDQMAKHQVKIPNPAHIQRPFRSQAKKHPTPAKTMPIMGNSPSVSRRRGAMA